VTAPAAALDIDSFYIAELYAAGLEGVKISAGPGIEKQWTLGGLRPTAQAKIFRCNSAQIPAAKRTRMTNVPRPLSRGFILKFFLRRMRFLS